MKSFPNLAPHTFVWNSYHKLTLANGSKMPNPRTFTRLLHRIFSEAKQTTLVVT